MTIIKVFLNIPKKVRPISLIRFANTNRLQIHQKFMISSKKALKITVILLNKINLMFWLF